MEYLQFFAKRTSVEAPVFVIFLLLLMPSFLVISQNRVAAPSPPVATSSPQPSIVSTPNPVSTYKSLGLANPSMSVLVSVEIPLRNLPLLSSYVKQSSDPSSANFRHFLSSSQVSQMFLPTASQYNSVADYLTTSGFTLVSSALNSMIVVRGTASQVNQYLGQNVQLYTNGTYSYYATTGATKLSGAYSYGSNSSGLFMRPNFIRSASTGSGALPSQNVTFAEGGQSAKVLQAVYNSTGLLAQGNNGKGYTVGLLDFYGYPQVGQDLALFDQTYGFPAPPSFVTSPIGPYNPNLGVPLGWDGEIDLDVQVSHAMAPGANIVLYAANGELPLSTAIAGVIQDGRANVLSQSFGIPEWEYYEIGPLSYLFNMVFADDYYMLGSAMGVSFLTSSGDAGGSGYSVGPMGGAEYPGSSPFVTTLGGTATYVSTTSSGALSVNQTAWSNIGFVPYLVNEGGGGGGVSVLEPTPWYQSSLPVPTSFPAGRMSPDLSLDSSGTPGVYVIYRGAPAAFGGTSEASPLFAGLLTLLMGAQKGSLGLVNPVLYQLAENAQTYQKAYTPITFGYTTPWVSKFGYNLATGWGAPNIGEMASLYASARSAGPALTVNVAIGNPGKYNFTDFTPGKKIIVNAGITSSTGILVDTGTFTASLQTLAGSTPPVTLAYNATQKGWTGNIVVGNQSGVANINVAGSSGTQTGQGFATTYTGYLAAYVQPLSPYPWTFLPGLEVAISITDLFGNNAPFPTTPVAFQSYSILTNTYKVAGTASLNYSNVSGYFVGNLQADFPSGPMVFQTEGPVAGYLPFVSGISLLGSTIYPQVVAEPGSIAPGQSLTIVASITAPENIYLTPSLSTGTTLGATIAEGSNVTATLVSPSGFKLETVSLPEQPCTQALRVCGVSLTLINGYMTIPSNATPGLYTVLLNAGYNDETTGYNYTGSYFGQVYVSAGNSVPSISVAPSMLFEGQNATIKASIAYPSGKEVTKGLYDALVYPETAQYGYSVLEHQTYAAFGLIQLTYDAKINMWTANATMPSPYDSSLVSSTNANSEYYGGPYDVYVSGLSFDGVPTSAEITTQQPFFVQPFVYVSNTVMTSLQQTSRLALSNVTINAGSTPLTLSNDYFVGTNTVTGSNVTIASSTINGTLNLSDGQTTLIGVIGGDIVATGTNVVVQHSSLSSLDLSAGATGSMDAASTSRTVTPALPVLSISSPTTNGTYTGSINAQVTVRGAGVSSLSFWLDGAQLPSVSPLAASSSGQTISYPINTELIADGTHTLTVVATQADLMTSSSSVTFATDNQLTTVNNHLASANNTINTLNGNLNTLNGNLNTANGDINSLQNNLDTANHTITTLTYLIYVAIAIAAVGLVLAVYALKGGKTAPWKY